MDSNLYYVDRILKVQELKGQLVCVVKWQGFNYKNTTKQSLVRLKDQNPALIDSIQKKEEEFKFKAFKNKIEKHISIATAQLRNQLYSSFIDQDSSEEQNVRALHPDNELYQDSSIDKKDLSPMTAQNSIESRKEEKSEISQIQAAFCLAQAQKIMARRLKAGTGNLDPQDYFTMNDLLVKVSNRNRRLKSREQRMRQAAVRGIKGVYKQGKQLKFCLQIREQIVVAQAQKIIQICPLKFYNYLIRLLKIMRSVFKEEIQIQEIRLKNKRYKYKTIQAVTKTLNITQHMENNHKQVHFGLDPTDLLHNIKLHKETFLQRGDEGNQWDKGNDQNQKKNSDANLGATMEQDIKSLYEAVKKQIQKTIKGDLVQPQTPQTRKKFSSPAQSVRRSSRSKSSHQQSHSRSREKTHKKSSAPSLKKGHKGQKRKQSKQIYDSSQEIDLKRSYDNEESIQIVPQKRFKRQ